MSSDIERAIASLCEDHQLFDTETARSVMDAHNGGTPLREAISAHVSEVDLLRAIADELQIRFYDMHSTQQEYIVDEHVLRRCDHKVLTRHAALPLTDKTGKVAVAMANPADIDIVSYLRTRFPEGFQVVLSPKAQVLTQLLYHSSDLDESDASAPNAVPDWVDRLLERAVAENASDIHFRFLANGKMLLRLRVDGVLRQVNFPLIDRESEVVATIMAKCATMDSSNLREPQDGTFSFQIGGPNGRSVDARVNMLPQITGPNTTVRILDSVVLKRRPEDMGFNPDMLEMMRSTVASPQGCVLVVGPTGSGKTTTLYSLLREVDAVGRNVLTVEDPVEYRLPFIGQTQIRADLGDRSVTFARALRAIVRADPDVILVGEIRDTETAKTAMDAAITGHLVMSTLHARTAPGAYMRLGEMGVPRFLVAEAVSLIVSQRLIRRVHECAQVMAPSAHEKELLAAWQADDVDMVPRAVGCAGCNGIGYRGRLSVAELLVPDNDVREAVAAGRSRSDVVRTALNAGWQPIIVDGLRHLRDGRTTIAELTRVLGDDDGDLEQL